MRKVMKIALNLFRSKLLLVRKKTIIMAISWKIKHMGLLSTLLRIKVCLNRLKSLSNSYFKGRKGFTDAFWHWRKKPIILWKKWGQSFDVTRERIRQIEAKALRKLRHPSRSKKLKAFIES